MNCRVVYNKNRLLTFFCSEIQSSELRYLLHTTLMNDMALIVSGGGSRDLIDGKSFKWRFCSTALNHSTLLTILLYALSALLRLALRDSAPCSPHASTSHFPPLHPGHYMIFQHVHFWKNTCCCEGSSERYLWLSL